MKFIYLSTLCTKVEYESIFKKYGTVSSHASQKYNRMLLYGLKENGADVEALSFRPIKNPDIDDLEHQEETENGIRFSYIPHCRCRKINRIYTVFSTLLILLKMTKGLNGCVVGVDTINGELSIAAVLCSLLRRKVKTCAIVTDVPVMRANDNRKGIHKIPVLLKNYLISRYDSYVFLTEKMSCLLNKKSKPYVIIEGICDNSELPISNIVSNKYPEKVIMLAGLLEKEYGADKLVEVFHDIADPQARLYLYGKGKSESFIRKYESMDSRIHFFGEAPNDLIVQEECRATFLINPRPADGEWTQYSFPSKNIEYICSGTPLIAYRLHCIPEEYLEHFIVIDDENFKGVLESWLKRGPEEINAFGKVGRNWIIREKNPKKQTEKMADMLQGLVS